MIGFHVVLHDHCSFNMIVRNKGVKKVDHDVATRVSDDTVFQYEHTDAVMHVFFHTLILNHRKNRHNSPYLRITTNNLHYCQYAARKVTMNANFS